jgi:trigger factor
VTHELKTISPTVKELVITIDANEALADYQKTLKKFKQYVQIPGFRKGKAPISKVESMYGEYAKEQFFDEALENYYKKALIEIEESPINAGEPIDIKWEKGSELVATFRFEVMPIIEIKKYKDLEIPFEAAEFKPEMVEETIADFQKNMAIEKSVEGEIAEGNIVRAKIDFIGENGEVTKSIEREFAVGNNPYSETFNEKVAGSKVGDEFNSILFDENAATEDDELGGKFRGKEFKITILEANEKELPEVNDDFAKDLEYDSLEDLRNTIEIEVKKKIEQENKDNLRAAIIRTLVDENPLEMPKSFIKKYAEDMARPYAEAYGFDIEKLLPMYEQMADFNMKSHYILEEIKKLENIKFTDEDKEKLIEAEAKSADMELEKYKELNAAKIDSKDYLYIAEEEKVLDIIKESSKFVPIKKEETEK